MMKKLILLIAAAGVFLFSNVSAQEQATATTTTSSGLKIGIGADFALPTGDMNDLYKAGFGGTIQFQMPIVQQLDFVASAGFLSFKGDDKRPILIGDVFREVPTLSVIPVKAGLRYFLLDYLYVGAEAGAAFNVSSDKRVRRPFDDDSSASFIYTPHIGVDFPVADKGSIDVSARYESWKASDEPTNRFAALRVAYNFGL